MRLQEVKEIFEENGEFLFKMIRFRLSAFSDEFTGSQPDVYEIFQSQFLSLLKLPLSKDRITRPCALSQLTATGEMEKSDCETAEDYFYDILYSKTPGIVPQNIIYHLEDCRSCSARLAQFAKALEADLSDDDSDYVSKMTGQLICHFCLLDMDIDCQTAREFLPLVYIPEFEIKIPTPVTTHLDQCISCTIDSARLEQLNLTTKQRSTLSRFYTKHIFTESGECRHAQPHIPSIARMHFQNIPAQILRHVCLCKSCTKLLADERLDMIDRLGSSFERPTDLPCNMIMPPDLFDYSFPFGLDPADDQYAMFRESLTRHLRRCTVCLDKICKLSIIIHNIALRPESGVVTCYNLTPSPVTELADRDRPAENTESAKDLENAVDDYDRYGLNVEVSKEYEHPLSDAAPLQTTRQKPRPEKLKKLRIPAAAAAVILIAVALSLFLTASPARAIDLSTLYEALAKVKNVCISTFAPHSPQPIQKEWVSKASNVMFFQTGEEFVLWDIPGKVIKTKHLSSDFITITPLSEQPLAEFREIMECSFGLVPFDDITDIPENARWNSVDDKNIKVDVPDTKVYDLTFSETKAMVTQYHKWRVFVDIQTNLPKRTQWYVKTDIEGEYILESIKTVTYPTDSEINAVLQSAFKNGGAL